jgi:DNA-binding NtrC family response regulator
MAELIVIDDEEEWRDLYTEKLSELGHMVWVFGDGSEAIREINEIRPDLVVLDIRMAPSGRQLLWLLKRTWPELPVVVSSAYVGYRADPDFARANAFVEKTADLVPLLETIERILPVGSSPRKPTGAVSRGGDADRAHPEG